MKKFFDFLIENKITPNNWFVLFLLHGKDHSDAVVAKYFFKNEYLYLQSLSLLKGDELSEEAQALVEQGLAITTPKQRVVKKLQLTDCAEQIEQYNLCFPKGRKDGTSSSFRANPKELVERFNWFFKEYPEYTWENVLDATKLYTKQFIDSNDFTYLQLSKYFIKKDDKNKTTTSSLANVCYNIAQGNVSDVNDGYHYFGAD